MIDGFGCERHNFHPEANTDEVVVRSGDTSLRSIIPLHPRPNWPDHDADHKNIVSRIRYGNTNVGETKISRFSPILEWFSEFSLEIQKNRDNTWFISLPDGQHQNLDSIFVRTIPSSVFKWMNLGCDEWGFVSVAICFGVVLSLWKVIWIYI